ncbi:MAG: hypothetical protein IJI42_05515 [Methanobrevibacter sp.]|nr:hypothetical protein [Methanobrevibacter sp.]
MSEKRFYRASVCGDDGLYDKEDGCIIVNVRSNIDLDDNWNTVVEKLNEQQELIEELQVSDEMGWKRAERFEKKCSKELHNKKMYIKRLEYKVQKFKEENEELKLKIVSLENEVQRQTNELKNTRKEFTKKTEELNWLKSEDYLKKIY